MMTLETIPELPPRYTWVKTLGTGGAGIVAHVYDRALEVDRAIKILHVGENANERVLHERIVVEARVMARLNHRNVLRVHDVSLFHGRPYIVMDLAKGGTLSARLRANGPMPPQEVFHLLVALLQALQHAHDAGVIHRDVKPQNILFDELGTPMLADFGIAMRTDAEIVTNFIVAGTSSYMAPEQRHISEDLDVTVDLYALAKTMIAALRGRGHRKDDHAIEADPSIPADWRPLLARACHTDPRQRYRSADELRVAAHATLDSTAAPASPTRPPTPTLDLSALRSSYVERLHERVDTLEVILAGTTLQTEHRHTLRRLGHQLKGSGGTYGFTALSEAASLVEAATDAALADAATTLLLELRAITNARTSAPNADVWVVDDDPDMVAFIRAVCADIGVTVASTSSATTFMAWFEQTHPRFLLLDLQLEGEDGRDLLGALDLSGGATQVIVISAHDSAEVRQQCLALGASAVLRKPLSRRTLEECLTGRPFVRSRRTSVTVPGRRASLLAARQAAIQNGRSFVFGCLALVPLSDDTLPLAQAQEALEHRLHRLLDKHLAMGDWQSGTCYFMVLDHARHQVELLLGTMFASSLPLQMGAATVSACAGLVDGASGSASHALELARAHLERALSFGPGQIVSISDVAQPVQTIVLVDDDLDLAAMVTGALASDSVTVVHLASGADLLNTLREVAPSLLLLDIGLPDVSGLELLELVKSSPEGQGLPIIMVTGRSEAQNIDVAFELGASDYIQKPFVPVSMAARVRRYLKREG